MIYKKMIFIARIIFIALILSTLLEYVGIGLDSKVGVSQFINDGFKDITLLNSFNEKTLSLLKLITSVSMYLTIEINTILFATHSNEGFKEIIRYHSKNEIDYIRNMFKALNKYLLIDLFSWIVCILIAIFIYGKIAFLGYNDIFILLEFLLINSLVTFFIMVSSNSSLSAILMYILKIFIYTLFLGNEYMLALIIISILLIYIKTNTIWIGEKNE